MATWCLVKSEADKFKKGLKDGSISPEKLVAMTSAERRAYLAKFVNEENAQRINALFESKLLLKNQQAGMISWAKKVSGITPAVRRDLITKIERLDKVLEPKDEKLFLNDLVSTRLGVDVTQEEAKTISEYAKGLAEAKNKMKKDFTFPTEGDRLDYGRAKIKLINYVNGLKEEARKIPLSEYAKTPGLYPRAISNVAGTAKALKASLDDSAIFRQGWKTLFTNPLIWQKNARQTFVDAIRTFGNKPVMDEIQADIVSRPNFLNGNYEKMKLATGNIEEAFPTTLPEKIPVFGRVYKASENAFTGFVFRQRVDIADKYLDIAKKSGIDLDEKNQLPSIGKLVNSLTGRGDLGKGELVASAVNNVFFSPRKLKADIDLLTLHAFDKNFSKFARKQAIINLLKVVAGVAGILGIAKAVKPDSVEFDPRSSDFGKIRVGDTRFDVTAGMGSIITLASRLITMSSKSSTTGNITKLNDDKFGAQTGTDVIYNFFENKLSPMSSVIKDLVNNKDFKGNKPTVSGELNNLFMPLPITTYQELKDNPESADALLSMMADFFGISTNTYPNANIKSGAVEEGKKITNESLIDTVLLYSKALGTDPETTFNRIFTGQRIKKVSGDAVIVERMPVGESQKVKKSLNGANSTMKLDHTIPLELGGSNDKSNLKLVPTAQWSSYTKVENALGKAVKEGKISKKEAQKLIVDFKNGAVKGDAILYRFK